MEDPRVPFTKPEIVETPHEPRDEMMEEGAALMEETGIGEGYDVENLRSWNPEFPRPSKKVIQRLLFRPEDSKRELDKLFALSQETVQKSLKHFLNKYPTTHVIKIDGNCPPTQMFYVSLSGEAYDVLDFLYPLVF